MNSIGKTHDETINAYRRAIQLAKELLLAIDDGKMDSFASFRRILNMKSNASSFILGILASLVASYLWVNGTSIFGNVKSQLGL